MFKKDKIHKDYGVIYREYKPVPVNIKIHIQLLFCLLTFSAVILYVYVFSGITKKEVIMTVIVYGLYAFALYKELTLDRKKTVFAICSNGIYAPNIPLGKDRCFIPWEEVKAFWIQGFATNQDKPYIKNPYLFIDLYNLDEYYGRLSWFSRESLSREKNNYRSHLNMNLLSLDCDEDELLASLENYKKKYKKERIRRIMAGAAGED